MPLSKTSIQILFAALLAAVILIAVTWRWQQRGDVAAQARQSAIADAQCRQFRATILALERQLGEARQRLQECSNAVASATAELQKEAATHAPLRRQIEAMMEQQVREKDQVVRRDRLLSDVQASFAQAARERDALRLALTNAVNRTAALESDAKAKADSASALAAQVAEVRKELATAQAQVAQLQTQLTQTGQQLDLNERALTELRETVKKAQADQAAAQQAAQKAASEKAAVEQALQKALADKAAAEKALAGKAAPASQ